MNKKDNKYFIIIVCSCLVIFSHINYANSTSQMKSSSLAEALEAERLQQNAEDAQKKMISIRNKVREKNCEQAKSRLEVLTTKSRIRIKTNDSTRTLSEEERQGEIAAAQSAVKTYCLK